MFLTPKSSASSAVGVAAVAAAASSASFATASIQKSSIFFADSFISEFEATEVVTLEKGLGLDSDG